MLDKFKFTSSRHRVGIRVEKVKINWRIYISVQ